MTSPIKDQLDERIRQILDHTNIRICAKPNCDHKIYAIFEATNEIITLIANLASEAAPEKIEHHDLNPRPHNSEDWILGRDGAIDTYKANWLRALGRET